MRPRCRDSGASPFETPRHSASKTRVHALMARLLRVRVSAEPESRAPSASKHVAIRMFGAHKRMRFRAPRVILMRNTYDWTTDVSPQHRPRKPPRAGDLALSPAAQAQSGGLVGVGPGGACGSAARQPADPALGR